MAKKKYIKDSRGTTVSITTDTLGLEKPLLNENYDIDVHNRNMDKIDEDLKPIDDSYIIELFQHDGDTTNPRDYYTKVESDEKFASKEEVKEIKNDLSKTKNIKYSTKSSVKKFACKNGYIDNITMSGLTKILNNNNEEVEPWTDGVVLVSVGQGDKIEVLTKNSDETKTDKQIIPTTLRSLPNGVKDTIEKQGNTYVKVQRCGEVTLNGSEEWTGTESDNDTTIKPYAEGFMSTLGAKNTGGNNLNVMCNAFSPRYCFPSTEISEGVYYSHTNTLHIRISKTKASDLSNFKTWLKSNPVTLVYELETPIIIELPNFNPQTYEGDTTLLLNSGVVQAECEFEVTNSKGSEIEILKDKVSNLDLDIQKAFQRGDNVKTQLVDKLISEGLNVSTNNTFEELINSIVLGGKWASGETDNIITPTTGSATTTKTIQTNLEFIPSRILLRISTHNIANTPWTNVTVDSSICYSSSSYFGATAGNRCSIYITDINKDSFKITITKSSVSMVCKLENITWYAYE